MRGKRIAGALAAIAAAGAVPAAAGAHVAHIVGDDGAGLITSASGGVGHAFNAGGTTGGHVTVQGDRLYMGMYGVGLRIFDIGGNRADAPVEIGRWTPADSVVGPRAVADAPPDAAVLDGRHIAVVNGTNRTSRSLPSYDARTDNTYFLDATDPSAPQLLWTFEGANDGESHNGDIVDERRLWLPSGGRNTSEAGVAGDNGLRIYGLDPLLKPTPEAPEVLFRGDPVKLWRDSPYRNGRDIGPAWDHTHDITVYPDFEVAGQKRDIALLVEGGSYTNDTGDTGSLFVIDISNPRSPVVLQRWKHPKAAGHHPIRYFHEAQFLDGDPRTVLVTDEDLHNGCDAGGVTALKLSEDLTSVTEELSEWFIADGYKPLGTSPFGPVCSVHVFSSHGNLAFFGSYNAGLQVVDYSDPRNPRFVGHNLQAGADSWGAQYHEDGLVYVGDFGARGLDVFRYEGLRPDLEAAPARLSERTNGRSRLTVDVRNGGGVKAPPVVVEVRDGDVLLASRTIESLGSGAGTSFEVPWDTKHFKGERTVKVTVDSAHRIDEANEANNTSSATFDFGAK